MKVKKYTGNSGAVGILFSYKQNEMFKKTKRNETLHCQPRMMMYFYRLGNVTR